MDEMLKSMGIDTRGIKYEDMNSMEKEWVHQVLKSVERNELSIEKLKDYVHQLRDILEQELVRTPETVTMWLFFQVPNRQSILLRARLENLRLIEGFLLGPERAKKVLQAQMDGGVKNG